MTEARWMVLVETERTEGRAERSEIVSLERNVSSSRPVTSAAGLLRRMSCS
jgi:hypothetical protein